MAYVLELPDSELLDIVREGSLIRLRLSAAAALNGAGQRGWLTSVTIEIAHGTLHSDSPHLFGRIRDAVLSHGDRRITRLVLPGTLTGPVCLALQLANDARIAIGQGHALEARLGADARFQEDFSC